MRHPNRSSSLLLAAVVLSSCQEGGGGGADARPAQDGGSDSRAVDGGGDARADAGACASPLDQDTLAALVISFEPEISLRPGQSYDFEAGVIECCYFLTPVAACVEWSVEPATGASIDGEGRLTIDADTPHGATFTVSAEVEDGRRVVSSTVHVYTPEGNPFVGLWTERSQLACASSAELAPEQAIQELRFDAGGRFACTWTPFEVYYDYWGTYAYDLELGTIALTVTGGNYVPPDVDGTGTFTLDGGELVLHDLWLGVPQGGSLPPRCGHRFD